MTDNKRETKPMKWQDHLVNIRHTLYIEGPKNGTYDTRRLIPPQRTELRMTTEQEERCTLVEITNGRFHVPCPIPIDPVDVFGEFLAGAMTPVSYNPDNPGAPYGHVSPQARVQLAKERYRRELAGDQEYILPLAAE